ncbi:MAG: DNA-binding protein [Clostridiales bacterium]|nr:DNA-binding protein [Clostridiales bacterium]
MAKNLEVTVLLDFYGDMLTTNQRNFLGYYYNDDLSLSEIAENEGITRQGVRDAIKRAENQLFEMESRLGLARRFREVRKGLEDIMDCASEISEYNMRYGLSREINDTTVKIKSIALGLIET